jgi:mitochondrial import receptor subunit TOM40
MHGMIDTSGNFQGKYNYTFPMGLTTKVQTMISSQQPGQSMIQFEGDWTAPSTSASASASGLTTGPASALGTAPSSAASTWSGTSINVKAINPDPSAGTGILTASLLQSVSKQLALGGEMILQRSADSPNLEQGLNLAARFTPTPKSTLTATLQQFVALQTSYHHRVSDKVELASELQLLLVGPRRDAVTSVGAKFEYRQATIRAQVDSTGRVGLLLEEKLFPGFSLLLSGELDHVRGASRFGIGLTMEN